MKTIRLTEHWAERDSGQGSVSNPSHQSNNNSTSNLHAQQLSNMMPASTSVSNSNLDRTAASAATAAIVLAGGCASVNNVTVNQVAIHQQQTPQIAQHHESGHDQFCNRKLPPESIRALLPFFYLRSHFTSPNLPSITLPVARFAWFIHQIFYASL